jgi:alanine racemase
MPGSSLRETQWLRARAEIFGAAFDSNWEVLSRQASRVFGKRNAAASLLPMVKADGYGHGAAWCVNRLVNLHERAGNRSALAGFGVATLPEGVEVRRALGDRPTQGSKAGPLPVVVFSGTLPWSDECGEICRSHALTPVISSIEDWRRFFGGGWAARVPFELKFNTGMNRLGIPLESLAEVRRGLAALALKGRFPSGIFSHLAIAEDPFSSLSRRQLQAFQSIGSELGPLMPDSTRFHLGNSAALWRGEEWRLGEFTSRARPGLSLYGIAPRDIPTRPLTPVLSVLAPIVALQELRRGDRVGYGGRFVAPGTMKIAILGMGYADGLPRLWGSRKSEARARVGRQDHPWLGSVSMDLSAIRAPSNARVGGEARILGPGVDIWAQADAARTIPYELLTSLSTRVQRKYV